MGKLWTVYSKDLEKIDCILMALHYIVFLNNIYILLVIIDI